MTGSTGLAIECVDLRRTYPGPPQVEALRGASIEIETGDHVAIVGRSGSGKSSLLNILGLLDKPDAGTYRLMGEDTRGRDDRSLTQLRAAHIGFVFQSFHLMRTRTAQENVAMGLLYRRMTRRTRMERAAAALEQIDLAHRADAVAGELSGGEAQRVAIARAVVASPEILLCDEPTGNLDEESAASVLSLLGQLNAGGATVVVVTHDDRTSAAARTVHTVVDGQVRS